MNPIPAIIHQTWKNKEIPEPYRSWASSVRRHHPGHEIWLWTDDDNRALIADRYPWFLGTYDSYSHDIERADAARYFILHRNGGLYLDLDIEVLRPMDALLGDGVTVSLEAGPLISNTVMSNACMAAPAGHPFFHRLIHRLSGHLNRDITHQDVFTNTGPDMLDAELARWPSDDLTIIGLDTLCPRGVLAQNPAAGGTTVEEVRRAGILCAIHHNTESWNVQQPPPSETPQGYVLFTGHDMPGDDRAYVQVREGDLAPLIAACDADDEAVAFNYNGFVKGSGGSLAPADQTSTWLKEGVEAWVCVKTARLGALRR